MIYSKPLQKLYFLSKPYLVLKNILTIWDFYKEFTEDGKEGY